MELISPIHGTITYEENEIIKFEKGIPGFQKLKKFIIKDIEENSPFSVLQSIEDKHIGFILIPPFSIYDNYEINLNEESDEVCAVYVGELKEKVVYGTDIAEGKWISSRELDNYSLAEGEKEKILSYMNI